MIQPETEPYVLSINISPGGIPKHPIESVRITFSGLEGDGHNHAKHNNPIQAVCLQDMERLYELTQEGFPLSPGQAGENLTVKNLDVNLLPLGTLLEFSGGVVLELSKIRKPCYVMDAIDTQLKTAAVGRHGMYAMVLKEGMVKSGDRIHVMKPALSQILHIFCMHAKFRDYSAEKEKSL